MLHQEVQKSSSWNSSSEANRSRFTPRPLIVQAQEESRRAPTQQETENEAFDQNVASRFGHNFADISVHAPDEPVSAPVQPQVAPIQAKSTVEQSSNKLEQQPDRVAQPAAEMPAPVEQRPNQTGLPDALKSGVEQLAGLSLDDVKVHYNSAKPAQLDALAFAQGRDIHVAPGQEQHLSHEAWHVVQQAQGRVTATMQMQEGVPVNDDQGLEHEADEMGSEAMKATRFVQRELREKASTSVSEPVIPGVFEIGTTIQPAARLSAVDVVVQRFVVPAGTRKRPLYYSSLDPKKRMFENSGEAEAHDLQLEQQATPQPQPQVALQPPAPVVANPRQKVEPARAAVPNAVVAKPPVAEVAPEGAEPANAARRFPLGFASEKEFRVATRPLARRFRDAEIVVTGSSVTGRSGDGTRAFRPAHTPKVPGDKKSGPSDIDIGVVKPDSVGQGPVDRRGFPKPKTPLGRFERKFNKDIKKATGGHPSGIKFFEDYPEEPRRGRSPTRRERPRIVRAHTPEGEREDEDGF